MRREQLGISRQPGIGDVPLWKACRKQGWLGGDGAGDGGVCAQAAQCVQPVGKLPAEVLKALRTGRDLVQGLWPILHFLPSM